MQPPEWETHEPPPTTSNRRSPLAKNQHWLYNPPGDVREWPQLHCNVCWPQDKESTCTSLQENNRCPVLCTYIHPCHHLSTRSATRSGIAPRRMHHSSFLVRCCEDSADEAANVDSILSRNRWSLWELAWDGCTLLTWLHNSLSNQLGWLPRIGRQCFHCLRGPFDEADTCWTQSRFCDTLAARPNSRPGAAAGQWISNTLTRLWIGRTIAALFESCQGWAVRCPGWTESWSEYVTTSNRLHYHCQCKCNSRFKGSANHIFQHQPYATQIGTSLYWPIPDSPNTWGMLSK